MNIYLTRHGESLSNVKGIYCGKTDVSLTDNGLLQTKQTAEYLKTIKTDCIYSSPLLRAREMAELICENITCDIRISERDFGIWEGLSYKEICKIYPTESEQWNNNWMDYKIPEGESCIDVEKRCKEFIKDVIKDNRDCIVVTHAGVIRNIITILLGMKTEDVWRFKIDNGSVTHIQITDNYAVLCSLNYIP